MFRIILVLALNSPLGIVLVLTTVVTGYGLQCRKCNQATYLDECTTLVPCGPDEMCYIDELITDQLNVVYEAGCRSKDVCASAGGHAIGKRQSLVSCSRCCTGYDCNSKLCNIKTRTTNNATDCYNCQHTSNPSRCSTIAYCQADEMCIAETYSSSGMHDFKFGCYNKQVCKLLTKQALNHKHECASPAPDPSICGNQGRRQARLKTCSVCCADNLCNADDCHTIIVWIGLVLLSAFAYTDALRCRRCSSARSLDDCTKSVPCDASTEECYMDETVMPWKTILYNAGCRAKDACRTSGAHAIGKRQQGQLTCSKCCSHDECNTALCNIKSSSFTSGQCYKCSGVSDMRHCTSFTTCRSYEMCMARTYLLSSKRSYESGCVNRKLCSLLTTEALKRMKECRVTHPNPELCGEHKRETSGQAVCTACCGDTRCNGDTCENVLNHLYNLWIANALDLHTLQSVSALPPTTTATRATT